MRAGNSAAVLVVGGGVVGASIACYLAMAGASRVVLCEQGLPPGTGASAKSGGLIRMHHTNPWQTRLAWSSYDTYAAWPEIIGGACGYHETGFGLVVGPEYTTNLKANVQMMRGLGIPVLELSPDDYRRLQPHCSVDEVGAVAYEPHGGYADPVQATLGFLGRGRQLGLTVMEGVRVAGLVTRGERVTGVCTNCGPIDADWVILAGGAWAADLVGELGMKIPVRSKQIGLCSLPWSPREADPPLWTYIDDTIGTYFRPAVGERRVLAGITTEGWDLDLERSPPMVGPEVIDRARQRIARRIPQLQQESPVGTRSGFDGYTPDEHPIVGPAPGWEGLYLATGFSGGGFKTAPAVGRAVASEVLSGTAAEELEPFRLERFETGELITPQFPYAYM